MTYTVSSGTLNPTQINNTNAFDRHVTYVSYATMHAYLPV